MSALPERALRDHIPPVLLSLARYIRFPGELARQELLNHLRLHGQIRRDQGYRLKEVLAEFDGLADIVTRRVNQEIEEAAGADAFAECLAVLTRLATGLRSVSYIAMGTFDESEEERTHSMSQRLEDFARTVAHELRGPLHTLHVGLAVLQEKLKDQPEPVQHVAVMQGAVARSATLVDSMMILAVAEQARASAHLVSISEAIDQVLKETSEVARRSDVEVQCKGEPPEVKVERAVVEIVLANLVSNAVKYSDPSKDSRWVSIAVKFIEEKLDTGFCEIQVSDNGLGIPEEFLPRICQRGFRAHPDHAVGTGLGLHIVQQLLAERGGKVEIDSVEGKGTTVKVRLRCLVADASALTAEHFSVDHLMGESALRSAQSSDSEMDAPGKPADQ